MPIGEGLVHVECDKCDYVSDPMNMTSLAGGGYDTRDIPRKLESDGWRVDGKVTICPDCVEKEAERT